MNLEIKRAGNVVATVPLDEQSLYVQKLMGEHKIVVDTFVPAPLPIRIGDYIEHNGETFYINNLPAASPINNFTYKYLITFEGEIYFLFNKLYLDEGAADFSYHGTPNDLLLLLLTNINSIQTGWAIADVDTAEPQTLTFSGDNCRSALTKIAEAFGMEYRLSGKNIYLKKTVGHQTTLTFEYGRGKGLYSLTREAVQQSNLVTKVYGFGAKKNISYNYRSGATRLVFQELSLEKNIDIYGQREGSFIAEDIYPQRTGTITGIVADDPTVIMDTSLDFDINSHLIEGVVAKIVFKTGALSGYQFEIKKYVHSTKRIEFLTFTEENGYVLPTLLNKPDIGDQYTLVDISMPQSYIDAAELELKNRTQTYLDENSHPRVTYSLDIDEKYVRDNGISLKAGDLVNAKDAPLGLDANIRVVEVGYPLVNPANVTAVISETVPYTIEERLITKTVNNGKIIKNVDRERAELARRATARMRDLQGLVFDPDGYFDAEKIKPQSIETLMLTVGAKSQNFVLNGTAISPNHNGDANALDITAGELIHYEIQIEGLGYVWAMDPFTVYFLNPAKHYYVYAKCSKTSLTGVWELSETPRKAEDEAGQYIFNLGVLYNVKDGRRDFDFTSGLTYVNGDTIKTGSIKSLDGKVDFNLTEGKLSMGDANGSLDWNATTPNRLTIRGSILQTAAGDPMAVPNYRGDYVSSTPYSPNDVVYYGGGSYIRIGTGNTTGTVPTNATYWKPFATPGAPGSSGQTTYTWIKYATSAAGAGLSDNPTGKTYIGLAHNKTSATESTTPGDYTWSLIVGPQGEQGNQGVPGPPGADGTPRWTWIKYSPNSNGSSMTDTPDANTLYIGIAPNMTTATESSIPSDYTWSRFKGDQGVPGQDGADGAAGPVVAFQGNHNNSIPYYYTAIRRDAVKYGGIYYLYKGPNGGIGNFNASQWESIGAQFSSVATDLLLAEAAAIADWTISGGKISSVNTYGGVPRAQLNGASGIITLTSPRTIYNSSGGSYVVTQTIKMDSTTGAITASHTGNATQEAGYTELSSDGLRAEFSGQSISNGIKQIRAGILADTKGRLNASAFGNIGAVVGVYGRAVNVQSGGAPSFGGYFEELFATAFHGLTAVVYSNGFNIVQQVFVICKNSVATTIYLPSSPHEGRMVIVKRTTNDITVQGNGKQLYHDGPKGTSVTIDRNGEAFMFIYDGTEWQIIILDHA